MSMLFFADSVNKVANQNLAPVASRLKPRLFHARATITITFPKSPRVSLILHP